MKKITTLLFFCCFVIGLSAQEEMEMIDLEKNDVQRFEVGIGINPLVNALLGNNSENSVLGLMLNYSLSEKLSHGLRFNMFVLDKHDEAVEAMRTSDQTIISLSMGYYFTKPISDQFNTYFGFDLVGQNFNSKTVSQFQDGPSLEEFISSNKTRSFGGGPILGLGYNYKNISLRAETTFYYLVSKSTDTFSGFGQSNPDINVINRRSLEINNPTNLLLFMRF